jgi:hypothetical protein
MMSIMLSERMVPYVPCAAWWPQRALFLGFACAFALASACAPSKPPEKPPGYFRSPTLDYQDQPRSAGDGEVMGANKQSVDDTLQVSPTNEHQAPGWEMEDGRLVPDRETRQRGYGSHASEPGCAEGERATTPAGENKQAANTEQDPGRKALQPVCKKKH